MATELMIQAEGLTKRYGETQALAGVDISVPAGTILGLLGPNGAGKTTAVRVLTTLARPDSGSATVAGIDVLKHPAEVRRHIGVAAQDATLDPLLTGRQNLVLIGELSDLGRADSRARAKELLTQFELTDAADRVVKGYSGGMRRRLDLAGALMTRPPVLFLDEPTTGLDPVSRVSVWAEVRRLNRDLGMTIFLTTQYLEEADELADRVGIINRGRIVAEGTPADLKRSIGTDVIIARVDGEAALMRRLVENIPDVLSVEAHGSELVIATGNGSALISPVAVALADGDVQVRDLTLRTPTLDDVFLELTGSHIERTTSQEGSA
jgi:ABC-2 type transport system ATP-binding protein